MARIKVVVDKAELTQQIEMLESANTYRNLNELWQAVAATEWAKNHSPKPLTPSVVYLRVQEFGIVTKTKPGKRLGPLTEEHKEALKAGRKGGPRRKRTSENANKTFAALKKIFPPQYHNLLERVRAGSKSAAIKANCLACVSFQKVEVRLCGCIECPMHPLRPYQNSIEEVEESENETAAA